MVSQMYSRKTERERDDGAEAIFKDLMAENFPG